MPTINELKELEVTPTPLFLFECVLKDGSVERWGTHAVSLDGHAYPARLLKHNLFELRSSLEDGLDGAAKVSVTLANADSHFSQVERAVGFKGSRLKVWVVFYDLTSGAAVSEARVIFQGLGGTADEITESTLRVTFGSRFNLQRIVLPEVRIQRRCPWAFPTSEAQRQEALTGGQKGQYSALYRCGYSAGLPGGEGTLNGAVPFTDCTYTRESCTARGMFALGRFGGMDFVPAQILVRSHGEQGSHFSPVVDNQARYNDPVPLVYGTAWYEPPVVFARNDGNLTHLEVLLGMGEIDDVVTMVINEIEMPEAVEGADMTATGWYRVVSSGGRSGVRNPDFTDGSGQPLGDPHGSMAYASVIVPNSVNDGESVPRVKVLLRGMKLERFDVSGVSMGLEFTANPAWVLLDVLRRSGWGLEEVDVASFAAVAGYCDEGVDSQDLYGNKIVLPRYRCNLVVRNRKSAAELVRGIRAGSGLLLQYGVDGRLALRVEGRLATQQPDKPSGSNSAEELDGGWPSYEFSDGSAAFSGILRRVNGEPSLRLIGRSAGDSPNRYTLEFQDELNEYQQDTLSLVDVDDALLTGREVMGSYPALGISNFDQASRLLQLQLAKSVRGGTFVEFETSVRGLGLSPGDLITITYLKEGLTRQLFRVTRVAPGQNFQSAQITAQWHEDAWYDASGDAGGGRRVAGAGAGVPRALVGTVPDDQGIPQFGVSDVLEPLADGEVAVRLRVGFQLPSVPAATSVSVPLLSLQPVVSGSGGTLAGGQTLYYALSAQDANGGETALSFAVRARIPGSGTAHSVTLNGLSFSPGTPTFNVYRGASPGQLLRIAADQSVAASFTDTGVVAELRVPPDPNFHHANFYWRTEFVPETAADLHGPATIGSSVLGLGVDDFAGAVIRIVRGMGSGQERRIVHHTGTTFTVTPGWSVEPDNSSVFTVAESTWKFAGLATSSPAEFEGPRAPGLTVQITGRAANAQDRESAFGLSPNTRWQVGSGGGVDLDAPPAPVFGLGAVGDGSIEVGGIAFTTIENTRTITAGVLELFWWSELAGETPFALTGAVLGTDTTVVLNAPGTPAAFPLIQVGGEIMQVLDVLGGGSEYYVQRGAQGSAPTAHAAGARVYHLQRTTAVIPFSRNFFGSPASGTFRYTMQLPDVRIGAACMYMLNRFGNGEVGYAAYGGALDQGIRTLSGGQIAIQVEGYLAIQASAAPALVIERTHAVGDIFAVVREAPIGGDIVLSLRQDAEAYCTLTIPEGQLVSNVVRGFGLQPLTADKRLYLDISSVPGAPNTLPGRDLTVTLRM